MSIPVYLFVAAIVIGIGYSVGWFRGYRQAMIDAKEDLDRQPKPEEMR